MKRKTIETVICLLLLTSCKTNEQITYFKDINQSNFEQITCNSINYETEIGLDDELSISVSSIDPNAVAVFNMPLISYLSAGEKNVVTTPTIQTYLVDSKGDIDFPVLGKIKAAGLTRLELADYLQDRISAYAKSPLVTIKVLNFKISVLGEVNVPGTKVLTNERVSILDVIGIAGDLTIYGERNNILLIRENGGKKEFHRFDLTNSQLFASPYFYLKPNDIIYVEPNKVRKGNAKYSQSDQFKISVVSTIVGGVSVLASLAIALFIK